MERKTKAPVAPETISVTPAPQDDIDRRTYQLSGIGAGYERTGLARYLLEHAERLRLDPTMADILIEGALEETGIRHVGVVPVGAEVLVVTVPNPDHPHNMTNQGMES